MDRIADGATQLQQNIAAKGTGRKHVISVGTDRSDRNKKGRLRIPVQGRNSAQSIEERDNKDHNWQLYQSDIRMTTVDSSWSCSHS